MNPPPLTLLEGDTLVISPSQLDLQMECLQAWAFKYIHRREANQPIGALVAGKAFDAAINLRHLRHGSTPATAETEAAMCAEIDNAFAGVELPLDEHRTPARFKEVARLYNAHYGAEPFRIHAVQLPFAVRLGEIEMPAPFWERQFAGCQHPNTKRMDFARPVSGVFHTCEACHATKWDSEPAWTHVGRPVHILIHGILDMLVSIGSASYVLDTKTSSDWGPRKLAEWENAPQPKCYAWGMQELARTQPQLGLPTRIHGFMLNAVVVRPPYKRESAAASAKAKPREEFHRHIFPYTPAVLEDWRQNTLDQISVALGCFDRGRFIRNEKHCANHYGRACPYLDVCTLPREQRADCLGSDLYRPYKTASVFADAGKEKDAA